MVSGQMARLLDIYFCSGKWYTFQKCRGHRLVMTQYCCMSVPLLNDPVHVRRKTYANTFPITSSKRAFHKAQMNIIFRSLMQMKF